MINRIYHKTFNIDGGNLTKLVESFNESYSYKCNIRNENVPNSNKRFTDYLNVNQNHSIFLNQLTNTKL